MKTVLVLSILLCAAFAAPAEDKEKVPKAEAAVEALKEQMVAAPEFEEKMMKDEEVFVPEDIVPVARNAPVSEETAPESRLDICPGGWYTHNSRCYKFVSSPMNWYSAEEHCNSLDAQLASATNPREYSFLQQITDRAGHSIAWMGGFSLQGRWMWIDRQGLYYTNWYSTPSSSSSSSSPCMYLRATLGWGNTVCTSTQRFICSKSPFNC